LEVTRCESTFCRRTAAPQFRGRRALRHPPAERQGTALLRAGAHFCLGAPLVRLAA